MTYFSLRAYTGTGVSNSQHRKSLGEGLEKSEGEWTGRVEISKEEIPGSKRSMYGYIIDLLLALKGEPLSSVLNRWDFNFCVRSSPLREDTTVGHYQSAF